LIGMAESDPLWFKDVIIYQVHVKAFFDSNNDGVGDFPGLTSKLDYLKELGINAIWLLPFYPSPMRDDGYDIAEYRDINPAYGTMADFRIFVRAAHARDIRVITELVINHTSDQHPWFQRARSAKEGSSFRDYYVWSDNDRKYDGTRIIFSDTEISNWAWDPSAKSYYWHRFFSHQPDLNFDNPRVLKAVINVMRFWLDAGVDGLRLDAVPYLCERDGTSNENLPETHAVIRQIRGALDARYESRMLLGEANMWPEDVRAYFGDGDECHMAFHFPLMPRIFMAVAREDRHPIMDIMRQTPDIPENCQWATFLRNHDELTLEMVTDRERDYMWDFYAADRRARINFGIRRRLAPLMGNDRRKIELLYALLMSLPGTPILYYGDELGMGDNIFLGDRNSVRTPMQWSPDRNGGFSLADPNYLYLPALMDPIYGFQAVNVEAQRRSATSLLNWTRQLISVVKAHRAFGRGSLRFFQPSNRKILAFLRTHDDETVLCVANLSPSPQPVELNLQDYKGYGPIELMGRSHFPLIGDLPYLLTLPAYGFFWFLLVDRAAPEWQQSSLQQRPDFLTLVAPEGWASLLKPPVRGLLEAQILPTYLLTQRWYGAKDAGIPAVEIVRFIPLDRGPAGHVLALLRIAAPDHPPFFQLIGLSIAWEERDDPLERLLSSALARIRKGARLGVLYDASGDADFVRVLLAGFADTVRTDLSSELIFTRTSAFTALDLTTDIHRLGAEQSNSSSAIGDHAIVKMIRKPEAGPHPEAEIGRFLTESSPFGNTPPLLGTIAIAPDGTASGERITIGILQGLIANQGDGWKVTIDYLDRFFTDYRVMAPEDLARETATARHADYIELARRLGARTAELHRAFAQTTGDPAFDPEPVSQRRRLLWVKAARSLAREAIRQLRRGLDQLEGDARANGERLVLARRTLLDRLKTALPEQLRGAKTRLHGDYHLGQVLVAKNDFYILDFEGEPMRPLAERRAKHSPIRDIAGMLRSFDYAAWAALRAAAEKYAEEPSKLRLGAEEWREIASSAFLAGYTEAAASSPGMPDPTELEQLLAFFLIEKACYEIVYEMRHRPEWAAIPVNGLTALLQGASNP
jgi:maltose alpha-D-glucosyltransferase / alpha-amylase